ncbi:MAG: hypothetical protein KKB90_10765 [Actinobacteria bacterium]|nr:hypothetical protein [Actinomycetota bacterium]MCG2818477.1 hypothetical protein [Actinomycetes bacterium]MBU4219427.1 hypothetical protein [Actinomycetota bacterium]MBU4358171.1 hypothetical protein [Actinomycetota bacterium]MBU4392232.1 hypothetical protein [Actinomycetota bacterium]
MAKRRSAAHAARGKKKKPKKGLDFRFFLVVCLILAGTGVFILVQHQYSISSDLKVREIDQSIEAEKADQKSLRVSLARLKSPARVTRMAQDELEMSEPTGVIYLKYSRDEAGNLICQSTFEERAKAPPKKVDTGYEPGSVSTEEPSGPLTLSAPLHRYAGIRTPLHPLRPRSAPLAYYRSTLSVARLAGAALRRSRCATVFMERGT